MPTNSQHLYYGVTENELKPKYSCTTRHLHLSYFRRYCRRFIVFITCLFFFIKWIPYLVLSTVHVHNFRLDVCVCAYVDQLVKNPFYQ